jgi:hypothetical protein
LLAAAERESGHRTGASVFGLREWVVSVFVAILLERERESIRWCISSKKLELALAAQILPQASLLLLW